MLKVIITIPCSVCGAEKPLGEFHNSKANKSRYGKSYKCKPCELISGRKYSRAYCERKKEERRIARGLPPGAVRLEQVPGYYDTITCGMCKEDLPRDSFHNDSSHRSGKMYKCMDCAKSSRTPAPQWARDKKNAKWRYIRKQDTPETAARRERANARAQEFRNTHPEVVARWESSARGRRAERVAAARDGSLTGPAFGKIIMEFSDCPYCGKKLTRANRSPDHMDPLFLGGSHSVSNLIVCCHSCNTRKQARPFAEWLTMIPEDRRELVQSIYDKKQSKPLMRLL